MKLSNYKNTLLSKKDKRILIIEDVLALITLFSLVVIALETVPDAKEYISILKTIEYVVVGIFTVEYVARISFAKNPFKYIFSFYGVVDLISILPTLVGLGGFVFLKSLRVIRISRSLRMLRVFKFSEVAHDIDAREKKESEINFFLYIKSLLLFTVFFGSLIYIAEFNYGELHMLPDALAWSFKLLVGVTPLQEPQTIFGEAVKVANIFSGFLLLGVLVYIIRSKILEKFSR